MPQMFPLMWFMLFMSIFLTLIILLTMTHFSGPAPSLKISSAPKMVSLLNWKW